MAKEGQWCQPQYKEEILYTEQDRALGQANQEGYGFPSLETFQTPGFVPCNLLQVTLPWRGLDDLWRSFPNLSVLWFYEPSTDTRMKEGAKLCCLYKLNTCIILLSFFFSSIKHIADFSFLLVCSMVCVNLNFAFYAQATLWISQIYIYGNQGLLVFVIWSLLCLEK